MSASGNTAAARLTRSPRSAAPSDMFAEKKTGTLCDSACIMPISSGVCPVAAITAGIDRLFAKSHTSPVARASEKSITQSALSPISASARAVLTPPERDSPAENGSAAPASRASPKPRSIAAITSLPMRPSAPFTIILISASRFRFAKASFHMITSLAKTEIRRFRKSFPFIIYRQISGMSSRVRRER